MTNGSESFDGEFSSSDDWKHGFIAGQTFSVRRVDYSVVNGLAMFEGDIVLGTDEELSRTADAVNNSRGDIRTEGAAPEGAVMLAIAIEDDPGASPTDGVAINGFRWTNRTVPYEISASLPSPQRVSDAIAHWEGNTPIKFIQRDEKNQDKYPNYVSFEDQGGCWSLVGMRGGKQVISLGAGCSTGNAIHEIGHAVGLWHEQSREDRDDFVTIVFANIISGREGNFLQHITDGTDIGSYDYGSIMHYPAAAFTKNGQPTIIPKGGQSIGQRNALSSDDVAAVNSMYP